MRLLTASLVLVVAGCSAAVPSADARTEEEPHVYDPRSAARWGLIVAVSAWFPYLYWALVVWRGDFSRVSLHPWIEASIAGLAVHFFAARDARAARR